MQRMYQLCNLAAEDMMTELKEDLRARFHWKAMTLAPKFTDAMVLVRFVVVKEAPESYYVELRELSSGQAFSGRGRSLIDAKSEAVFSYVTSV